MIEILKKYWWIVAIFVFLIIWYYYSSQEEEQKEDVKKKKFTGGAPSSCEEVSIERWNQEKGYILQWLDWQAGQAKRDEISCIYWEKSGDVWEDIAYRFAEDELQRKGFCKPK